MRPDPYKQDEYMALMDKFQEEKIPLAVAVVDMDWYVPSQCHKLTLGISSTFLRIKELPGLDTRESNPRYCRIVG
jgi:hypothetical protein